ncbi:MAG: Dabb family protein, partial [Actinobacteria bacterium]|nr:Dabb family protein [Actinomycetota bacterium]
TNADYLIVATFDDVAGWREYDESALHNEIRATYFKPYIATRAAAQIEF